jgi:hypothetical protein
MYEIVLVCGSKKGTTSGLTERSGVKGKEGIIFVSFATYAGSPPALYPIYISIF